MQTPVLLWDSEHSGSPPDWYLTQFFPSSILPSSQKTLMSKPNLKLCLLPWCQQRTSSALAVSLCNYIHAGPYFNNLKPHYTCLAKSSHPPVLSLLCFSLTNVHVCHDAQFSRGKESHKLQYQGCAIVTAAGGCTLYTDGIQKERTLRGKEPAWGWVWTAGRLHKQSLWNAPNRSSTCQAAAVTICEPWAWSRVAAFHPCTTLWGIFTLQSVLTKCQREKSFGFVLLSNSFR